MNKYVFSATLTDVSEWPNSVLVNGDLTKEVKRLKQCAGDFVIWGHTKLAESMMRAHLIDVMDVSIHPVLVGGGGLLLRDGLSQPLRPIATKCFSNIVKVTYEPIYE
jgi:dihydrofolate reductase